MSKLERFLGRPKKVKIGNEELELKPLSVRDLDIIMDMGNDEKRSDAMKNLIVKTLKKSFPEDKVEDIEEFSLEYFEDLVKAILKVNNIELPEKDVEKAIKEDSVPK